MLVSSPSGGCDDEVVGNWTNQNRYKDDVYFLYVVSYIDMKDFVKLSELFLVYTFVSTTADDVNIWAVFHLVYRMCRRSRF